MEAVLYLHVVCVLDQLHSGNVLLLAVTSVLMNQIYAYVFIYK